MEADIDNKKIRNAGRKKHIERRKISLPNDEKIWKRLKKIIEFVEIGMPNLWEYLNGVIRAYDEVSGKERGVGSNIYKW